MSTQLLSRYEILESLGRGGMGEVMKARDLQLKRVVAIKSLLPGSLGNAEARARFLREARLAAQLNHPNIATIYDIFDADGETFIVMEYVDGETVRDRIQRRPCSQKEVLELGGQIARALAVAHQQRVIHRDIKSENIKINSGGVVKILDFGLAKKIHTVDPTIEDTVQAESIWMSQQGFAAGTPGYTAPEQWRGEPVDGRADIFSFGVVLYEMITGRSPFEGKTVIERITATLHDDPDPVTNYATVPAQLERVVRKALAKDPNQRYQSASELLVDLEAIGRPSRATGEEATRVAEPRTVMLAERYRMLTELGQGGMGKVYKAKDLKLDRIVAIKELQKKALGDETAKSRFLREANLLAQLNHPHIATIHDIIEQDDQIFIVMEYIEGERLIDQVAGRWLSSEDIYQLALEVAEALAYAHQRRIIHRDVKSANIMITPGGHAKVLDFGLAKRMAAADGAQSDALPAGESQTMAVELTRPQVTFGTPKYMSPEQRMTADVDERSDIFSYGLVVCEMLIGPLQMMGETVGEILRSDPQGWPSPLNQIRSSWRSMLKQSLAPDPRSRYQSFAELIADLRKIKDPALVDPTEAATVAVERPPVGEKPETPSQLVPTLLRSGLSLAPALYFVHKIAQTGGSAESVFYLLLTFLAPLVIFFLPQIVMRRSRPMHQLVTGTHALALGLLMANVILVLLTSMDILDFLGWQSWGDWRYAINREEVSPDIVLVAIDQYTQQKFALQGVQLSEPKDLVKLRQFHPQLLRNITRNQTPRVIAFDISFVPPSDDDEEFAAALRRLRERQIPVVVGQEFDPQSKTFLPTTASIRQALTDEQGVFLWGHPIVLESEADAAVRVAPLRIIQKEPGEAIETLHPFPSLSLLMATQGRYDQQWRVSSDGYFRPGGWEIPIDRSIRYVKNLPEGKYHYEYDNLLVNFPREGFRTVSYFDVCCGQIDQDFFQKYVLIGSEFNRFEPYKETPYGAWSPYRIHASALNTILRRDYIHRFSGMPSLLVLLLTSYLVFAVGIELAARSWKLLAVTAGLCIVLFATALFLFISDRVWFDWSYPGLAAVFTGLLVYWKR